MSSSSNLRGSTVSALEAARVVAIIRLPSTDGIDEVAGACLAGGVNALEVTLTVPGALDQIAALSRSRPELLLGAGTVLTTDEVRAAADAGARYIVSPALDEAVIETSLKLDLAVLPGTQTPTEMLRAHRLGADFVKLFPAAHLPPSFIKDVRAPMPFLKIVPTGGITPENVATWLGAGAAAVGVGSALVSSALVQQGDFAAIEERARKMASAAATHQR